MIQWAEFKVNTHYHSDAWGRGVLGMLGGGGARDAGGRGC